MPLIIDIKIKNPLTQIPQMWWCESAAWTESSPLQQTLWQQ